jgi:serine incorporator 1/3
VVFACVSLIRVAITTGSSFKNLFKKKSEGDEETEEEVMRNDCKQMFYSHLVFIFASFYLSMVLTNWSIETGTYVSWKFDESIPAVVVKVCTQFITFIIFIWTFVAPYLLGKWRKFHNQDDE